MFLLEFFNIFPGNNHPQTDASAIQQVMPYRATTALLPVTSLSYI